MAKYLNILKGKLYKNDATGSLVLSTTANGSKHGVFPAVVVYSSDPKDIGACIDARKEDYKLVRPAMQTAFVLALQAISYQTLKH